MSFSENSRKRLIQLLARVRREWSLPAFVTLTFPAQFAVTAERAKEYLDALFHRWKRRWPGVSAIWKIEPQKNGQPHFHVLVWGAWIAREELSVDWYQICGTLYPAHLKAGTKVETIRSWNGVMSYASKYLCKLVGPTLDRSGEYYGRFWGIHNRRDLPLAEPVIIPISVEGAWQVVRHIAIDLRGPEDLDKWDYPPRTAVVDDPLRYVFLANHFRENVPRGTIFHDPPPDWAELCRRAGV